MDTVILVLRVVVGLGAVFGALLFLHRFVTKRQRGTSAPGKRIAVVARQGLGAKAGIAIVDAAGRRYLLGVTEHSVTVLDTLGAVPADEISAGSAPTLVHTQPVTVARFEQELRTVTISTTDVPVLVHGAHDGPRGPITQTLAITRADADVHTTRRALRQAEQRRMQSEAGPLAGSVLSPATWRQTVDALKRVR